MLVMLIIWATEKITMMETAWWLSSMPLILRNASLFALTNAVTSHVSSAASTTTLREFLLWAWNVFNISLSSFVFFLWAFCEMCREGRKKQNLKCVRFNINGEARVLLVANRDISKGERLYYDYNGYEHEYPTENFV